MMANFVPPSSVMVLTRKAPGGTSPWSVPPDATFPVGFQLIGQNGLRVEASILNADLFFKTMTAGSSAGLFLGSAGAACSVLFWGALGAGFSPAANNAGAARIDRQMKERNLFIVFQ